MISPVPLAIETSGFKGKCIDLDKYGSRFIQLRKGLAPAGLVVTVAPRGVCAGASGPPS